MSAFGIPPGRRHISMRRAVPCTECGNLLSQVIDSRPNALGVRRRRVCENGHHFTTQEFAVSPMNSFDPVI